jgi:hypothetical protein
MKNNEIIAGLLAESSCSRNKRVEEAANKEAAKLKRRIDNLREEMRAETDDNRKAYLTEKIAKEKGRQQYFDLCAHAVLNRPSDYVPPKRIDFKMPEPSKHQTHPTGKESILWKKFNIPVTSYPPTIAISKNKSLYKNLKPIIVDLTENNSIDEYFDKLFEFLLFHGMRCLEIQK